MAVRSGAGEARSDLVQAIDSLRPLVQDIAVMAEYDALPGIGHGCGHNLIAASAVAAGIALKTVDTLDASWVALGTPAEETVGGKIAMVEAGIFGDIDAALMPVRLAGIVTHGGDAQNIVPELAQMKFTLRSTDWRYLEETVIPCVKRCAEGAASAFGATVEFRHHEPLFRDTLHYPMLADLARRSFEYAGQEVPPPLAGGGGVSDVGSVTWFIPCIQVGCCSTSARGHSREMAESTVTPQGIAAALSAAKVLALTAYDLASQRALLKQAKDYLAVKLQEAAR